MKQNKLNQLEDLLTEQDVTLLNRHTYIQNEFKSTPVNEVDKKDKRLETSFQW